MIRNVEISEHYRWGGVCDGYRLLDHPDLSVIAERIPPGAGELRHVHARARQFFFVLRGRLEIEIGECRFDLRAEDSLEVPPEQPHRVSNVGEVEAVFLVVSAPSTHGDRIDLETVRSR
jgi:mannose-6-phosphate isomerase-like protein (cupin superfamily)